MNDNPPLFPTDTLDVTIQENISDGFRIMQLTATDADEVKIPSGTDAFLRLLHFYYIHSEENVRHQSLDGCKRTAHEARQMVIDVMDNVASRRVGGVSLAPPLND